MSVTVDLPWTSSSVPCGCCQRLGYGCPPAKPAI